MGTILWIVLVGLPLLIAMNYIHGLFAKYIYGIKQYNIKEIGFFGTMGILISGFFTAFASAIILVQISPDFNLYLKNIFGVNIYLVLGYIMSIFIYSGLIKLALLLKK